LKAGPVFRVAAAPVLNKQTLETEPVGHAQATHYLAHLGGPEAFGQRLWAEAKRQGWTQASDTQVVADGVAWIWNLVEDHYYDSHQVMDWYHATQHLHHAAEQRYGLIDSPAKTRWLTVQKDNLFEGQAEKIVQEIRYQADQTQNDALRQEAGYFETHKRRMNYLDLCTEGWLIGSGTVESGAKQYKARFSGPRMRWKRACLERLIPVRSAVMSGTYNQVWRSVYFSPAN
jgi:hypothetical protein